MNIPENILSTLTDELKKSLKPQSPRRNSSPSQRKQGMNCPRINWKPLQAAGVMTAEKIAV